MKQSLLRALPLTFALCLALAACGAPATESDTSTPTSETAETPANPAAAAGNTSSTAIGAGEVHLLRETYGGGAAYALHIPDAASHGGSLLLRLDYATGQETPYCTIPGCDHQSQVCGAWQYFRLNQPLQLYPDGDRCYELYRTGCTLYENPEENPTDKAIAALGTDACLIVADGASRKLLASFPDLPDGDSGLVRDLVADDRNLYLLMELRHDQTDHSDDELRLLSVDQQSGATAALRSWTAAELGQDIWNYSLVGARGRTLYLALSQVENDPEQKDYGLVTGGRIDCFDLDTASWRTGLQWESEGFYTVGDGNSAYTGYERTLVLPMQNPTAFVRQDFSAGALTAIDYETGEEQLLCTGLPTRSPGEFLSYEITELPDWYVVRTSQGPWESDTRESRLFLIPRAGGEATEVTLQYYESAHGTQPIFIWDEWEGDFFCLYGYEETSFQDINKDGSLYEGTNFQELEGLLSAEDLLASTPNYRPVTPWNEAAR